MRRPPREAWSVAAHDGPKRASRTGGPRAEEKRLGDERARHEREVARQMVAFEPPAPPAGARRTEHRDVVEVGVERVEARVHALQDALERHDVERLPIARGRGARAQEAQREASLIGRDVAERKPIARHRRRHRPVPTRALGTSERERRPAPFARCQRREEGACRRLDRRGIRRRGSRRARSDREAGGACGSEPKGGRACELWLEVVVVHVRPTSELTMALSECPTVDRRARIPAGPQSDARDSNSSRVRFGSDHADVP